MYRGTVRGPEVTITTPDPCDHYEATVASQYMMPNLTCTGNGSPSKPLGGELLHYSTSCMLTLGGDTPKNVISLLKLKLCSHDGLDSTQLVLLLLALDMMTYVIVENDMGI